MSDILKALDDLYEAEVERIREGPFVWIGNRNLIAAVRGRMIDESDDLMIPEDDGVFAG